MLEQIFAPAAVAVVGASPDPRRLGHTVLKNIVDHGFAGKIFPIHPKADEVLGHKAYPSVLDVLDAIDLAVLVVPTEAVIPVVDECGRKGVQGLVIITAGFKEVGHEGALLEQQLTEVVKSYGMRMVGPNCLGVIDTVSNLNASFASLMPLDGEIAFMSQSGAVCTAILDWSKSEGIGFSRFVSLGNKADIDEVALLKAWNDDKHSKVILGYLEGINNGPAFVQTAREVTKNTPVIAIKSGTTSAGTRAISSHTGSLAGSESAYEAAFLQSGVLRARTMEQLFDFAMAFAYQPLLRGPRIAIVTNAGGPGIIATDAIEHSGLRMAEFTQPTLDKLRDRLPPTANIFNPVDVIGDATPERYQKALEVVYADPNVDGVLVLFTPQAASAPDVTANIIVEIAKQYQKPTVTSFMGAWSLEEALKILNEQRIPNYEFPERAVSALSAMYRHQQWREREEPTYRSFEADTQRVKALFDEVRSQGRVELGELEARDVMEAYGMRLPKSKLARSPEEAVEIAREIGFPVVMKISSPDILHKSDIGGVVVGVADEAAARDTYELISFRGRRYNPTARVWGVLVQEMAPKGREVLVGVSRDPQFGALVAFGMGGIYVEVLKDVAFRLAPISEQEVHEQVREIRSFPLLRGVRGEAPADIAAAEEIVLRVSQLVSDFPEIVEMDINPLMVYNEGDGALVLDARIILQG